MGVENDLGVIEYSFGYARYHINKSLADTTVITSENIGSVFNIETNLETAITLNSDASKFDIILGDAAPNICSGAVIISKKSGAGYIHNSATMLKSAASQITTAHAADVVLPTYPVGTEMFLNGGEL